MSLSLALAINAVADITIMGLLALVMSRATRLKPHNVQTVAPVNHHHVPRTSRRITARPATRSGAPLAARG